MTFLQEVIAYLERRDVPSALIGGVALAAHGIARATLDFDLLAVDRAVLNPTFWDNWSGPERPDVRRGDADDPLAGVVRFSRGQDVVDVVVGKHSWEAKALDRRVQLTVEAHSLFVVDAADLILLKLSAGGPQDAIDVRLLLAAGRDKLRHEVQDRLVEMPASVRETWRAIVDTDATEKP